MANALTGFWQTVVAAASEASQVLAPNHRMVESVYLDYAPEPATIGQTINVLIPGDPTQNVTDLGTGSLVVSDISFTSTPLVFSHHPGTGFKVEDFSQYNSPLKIRKLFMDAAVKGVKNYINNYLCSLLTTTNFTTNTAISATSHIVTTAQALTAYAALSDQFVPVQNNPDDMSFLIGSIPYAAILGDANWTQAQIAGQQTAQTVRATGEIPTAYGFSLKLDQQLPQVGAAGSQTFTAALFHRWAIALATRPMPTPETDVVDTMTIDFSGIPIRIMFGYNHLLMSYVVSVDCGFAAAVVRQNMGQLFSIAY